MRWVSIPFIAGQWSLRLPAACGRRERCWVSIPFIAGQWSLLADVSGSCAAFAEFQSPSLRGSGRFRPWPATGHRPRSCFNPLHCGAVVASGPGLRLHRQEQEVSIPFIAGQWSLPAHPPPDPGVAGPVSIPFIAGQWSLQLRHILEADPELKFQSPSLRGSGRFAGPHGGHHGGHRVSIPFIAGQWSLHWAGRTPSSCGDRVSIPFIAGQWSLPSGSGTSSGTNRTCLNPLHCGAVVASITMLPSLSTASSSLNPLHCGAVVASGGGRRRHAPCCCGLNPLHCGAVVASADLAEARASAVESQSPSLRGSGRFR